MQPNDTDGIRHRKSHAERAVEQLEIARIYKDTLDDLVAAGTTEDGRPSRNARIAEAKDGIGQALKIAEVHSNLAVAEAVERSAPVALQPAEFLDSYLNAREVTA